MRMPRRVGNHQLKRARGALHWVTSFLCVLSRPSNNDRCLSFYNVGASSRHPISSTSFHLSPSLFVSSLRPVIRAEPRPQVFFFLTFVFVSLQLPSSVIVSATGGAPKKCAARLFQQPTFPFPRTPFSFYSPFSLIAHCALQRGEDLRRLATLQLKNSKNSSEEKETLTR